MSLLFLEFVLIPKGTKQLEWGGLGAGEGHTKRVLGNAALNMGHDLCWDRRSSLPPTQGGLLSPAIEFCCPEPRASGAPTLLLDHSRLWPQPGAD